MFVYHLNFPAFRTDSTLIVEVIDYSKSLLRLNGLTLVFFLNSFEAPFLSVGVVSEDS